VSHLSESQKETLRKSSDWAQCYNELKASNDLDMANEKLREFTNYLLQNRIFITDDLRTKFGAVQGAFISALTRYETGKLAGDPQMQVSAQLNMCKENLQSLIDEVEQAIKKRLHYEET
jgi:hypothetical protein